MRWWRLKWLLCCPLLFVAGPSDGTEGEPSLKLAIGEHSPDYATHIQAAGGFTVLGLELRPEVRSISLRFSTIELPPGRQIVSVELFDTPLTPTSRPKLRGLLRQVSEGPAAESGGRVLRASYTLKPRKEVLNWTLRLQSEPRPDGVPNPLALVIEVDSDSRPISAREREIMAWRDRVDPAAQPEAVRELVARLTDEEVRQYTNFRDRATFLKHWGRTTLSDLRVEDRGLVLDPETRPLLEKGNPLPDGRYLHHNGKPIIKD